MAVRREVFRAFISFLWMPLLLVAGSNAATGAAQTPQAWPDLKLGIWEIGTTWTPPNGKQLERKEEASACHDATGLFQGYWGSGIVEKAGCRFRSEKLSGGEFRVTSECVVRGVGTAKTELTVTLGGDKSFTAKGRHMEGKRSTTIRETGRWRSPCPAPTDLRR